MAPQQQQRARTIAGAVREAGTSLVMWCVLSSVDTRGIGRQLASCSAEQATPELLVHDPQSPTSSTGGEDQEATTDSNSKGDCGSSTSGSESDVTEDWEDYEDEPLTPWGICLAQLMADMSLEQNAATQVEEPSERATKLSKTQSNVTDDSFTSDKDAREVSLEEEPVTRVDSQTQTDEELKPSLEQARECHATRTTSSSFRTPSHTINYEQDARYLDYEDQELFALMREQNLARRQEFESRGHVQYSTPPSTNPISNGPPSSGSNVASKVFAFEKDPAWIELVRVNRARADKIRSARVHPTSRAADKRSPQVYQQEQCGSAIS